MSNVYFEVEKEALMPQEELMVRPSGEGHLLIGLPKEPDSCETRIALTPDTVGNLVHQGHQVLMASDAGTGSGYTNLEYSEMGAYIVDNSEVFQADLLLKINPPQPEEIALMHEKQLLFSFLPYCQLTADYIKRLASKKITAIAFEKMRDRGACCPLSQLMSEIAGTVAIQTAARYLSHAANGRGHLLGGVSGVAPAEVIIIGAGTAAEFAARAALGTGAFVRVFDHSVRRLRRLQALVGQRLSTSAIHPQTLAKALTSADAVIIAAHIDEMHGDYLLPEEMVMQMKQGAVIIDLSINQGRLCETSELCDLKKPIVIRHNVVHYCVPNITATVPRTTSTAISNVMAAILGDLASSSSFTAWLQGNPGVQAGTYLLEGVLTDSQIGEMTGLAHQDMKWKLSINN